MDFKVMIATFGAVFLAELGDKTQLATMCIATTSGFWSVFAGSAAALVFSALLAAIVGCQLQRLDVIPTYWIKLAAGGLFLIMGSWIIWSTLQGGGQTPA